MQKDLMIIEPEHYEQVLLHKVFSDRYKLTFAGDADTALEILTTKSYDVIIYNMESVSDRSIEALLLLKAQTLCESLIIAITSFNSLALEREIAEINVYYHLIKPYLIKDLDELIRAGFHWCQRGRT